MMSSYVRWGTCGDFGKGTKKAAKTRALLLVILIPNKLKWRNEQNPILDLILT